MPFAAWVLVLLLALYTAQLNNSGNALCEIMQLYTRQIIVNCKRGKPYSRAVMIFCLTLAGYSVRAYKCLRTTVENCLPCVRTLRRYRHRVDGSPGFSSSALQMIKTKVSEMSAASKKLFVSLSSDDMSIRQHVWLTVTTFYGYEDQGEDPGPKPAKNVIMIMAI